MSTPGRSTRLERAIATAYDRGFLGADVMGHGFAFDVEIRRGAGAYICGEETAIFNSIEGYRGEPRNKPPFPVEVGLFGKPTLVNNVETLVNVLPILERGGAAYAATGTERSTGTKLFCRLRLRAFARRVRGPVRGHPGATSSSWPAAWPPAGRCRPSCSVGRPAPSSRPDGLDVPLTFEGAAAAGATLGSGVVMVLDDSVDLAAIPAAHRRPSSGTSPAGSAFRAGWGRCARRRSWSAWPPASRSEAGPTRSPSLADVAAVMRDASICGLGQTAASAIDSAIKRFEVFPA